jgi:hypothetical protein
VIAIVKAHGATGATPKEIREGFASRKISQSDNLIYTTLSALAKEKKLRQADGRYFGVGSAEVSKTASEAPAAEKKMSPAAIEKIRERLRKYWAAKRAATK